MSTVTLPAVASRRQLQDHEASFAAGSPGEPDDLLLLAAYLGGDERAFHTLVDRHQRSVYAVCFRYFGDRQDAEDATQEAFIALARRGGTIRGTARLSTWLHRVAVNACHDMARQRARRPRPARGDAPEVADGSDRVGERETELDVQAGLAALDPVSRMLLTLVALEDRSYADAAQIVGVSVPAAKSRIHRARARLADVLATAA